MIVDRSSGKIDFILDNIINQPTAFVNPEIFASDIPLWPAVSIHSAKTSCTLVSAFNNWEERRGILWSRRTCFLKQLPFGL